MDQTSVILAVASPPGRSLRGLLRVDGPRAVTVVNRLAPAAPSVRRGVAATRFRLDRFEVPAIVQLFAGPRSYTGNESAELQLPGNPAVLDRAVHALLATAAELGLAARLAEPGEFTARAFFNGRLTLTEAEGVAATIGARSDAELRAARLLTGGALGRVATNAAERVAAALALVEAGIDFTDQEDVVAIGPADLAGRLASVRALLRARLEHAVAAEDLQAIPWVVLTGAANAGKSTLFNALLGHERAIVSDIAGTTRDALAEPMRLETSAGAAEVLLVDIAGADVSRDTPLLDRMRRAAGSATGRADLCIRCVPCGESVPPDTQDALVVRTKSDLVPGPAPPEHLVVSAATGRGIDAVRAAVATRLANRAVSLAADAMALQPRHETALLAASHDLTEALTLVAADLSSGTLGHAELVAASMRSALDHLATLAGRMTPDDVLGRIFATFCVGK